MDSALLGRAQSWSSDRSWTDCAGYTIAIRVVMFTFLPAWGLSNAAATLVGQNLGAGRPDRAEKAVWMTGVLNMAFMSAVAVVLVGFPEILVSFFSLDGVARETGIQCLRVFGLCYPVLAWGMVLLQAFNGAGDTLTPNYVHLVSYWLVQIPLAWTLAEPVGWGPEGVFWAIAGSQVVYMGMSLWLFRKGRWKGVVV